MGLDSAVLTRAIRRPLPHLILPVANIVANDNASRVTRVAEVDTVLVQVDSDNCAPRKRTVETSLLFKL